MSGAYPFGFALSRAARGNLKFTNDCRIDIMPISRLAVNRVFTVFLGALDASFGIQADSRSFYFSFFLLLSLPHFPKFFNSAIPCIRDYVRGYEMSLQKC